MHICNGNTRLILQQTGDNLFGSVQLNLFNLLYPTPPITSTLEEAAYTYSRSELLLLRPQPNNPDETLFQTTTQFHCSAVSADHSKRSGRRKKIILPSGEIVFHKSPKNKVTPQISNSWNSVQRRPPPPRGAPGAPLRSHEECPNMQGAQDLAKGASRRNAQRRAYRRWRSQINKDKAKGLDPPCPAPSRSKNAAQTRAQWFRHSLFWQEKIKRKKNKKVCNLPTTTPLDYGSGLRFGALNVQGMADTLKLKNSIQLMVEHRLDVLFLSETKSTSYYSYMSEQHLVILSGNNKDKNAGVGAIISPRLRPHLLDVIQVNTRILHLCFKQRGGNVHLLGVYAPHSGLELEETRIPFWDKLEEQISKIPQPEPVYVTGDFNVRFQATHRNDEGVTGPHVFGKGARYIDHNAASNRSLCVGSMQRLNMVEVASYKTPNLMQQITYRDKAAPPKDWSQFLLDPLIMQQVYDKIHFTQQDYALVTASLIRSFLEMDSLLPPPKILPHLDPTLFQRLDHTFTRRQWLNSVNKCRSKLYTGFPSDHYLLVTDVRVRLAARNPRPIRPPQLEFFSTPESKTTFNAILRDLWDDPEQIDIDHNSVIPGRKGVIYTDGSGSRGKCSRRTPAGWGFCYQQETQWVEAYGPVVADSDHLLYRGAQVGSNNTGELTAILEALLHVIDHSWEAATIRSDSQWSIKVIKGIWRPSRHKQLVNYIRRLLRDFPVKIHLEWIKAHAGHEGNERADRLAEEGKNSIGRFGTNSLPPLLRVVSSNSPNPGVVVSGLQEAARQTFGFKQLKPKRPWITQSTLLLLAQARLAESNQDHNAKTLRNQAKRGARKDRINWIHARLTEDQGQYQQEMWSAARGQKRGFQGKKRHLIVDNKPVPWSQTHKAFRDHLQNNQWKSTGEGVYASLLDARRPLRQPVGDHTSFSLEELQTSINRLKARKAPGPDGALNELFHLLDDHNSLSLLEFYNKIWEKGTVPDEWKEAIVVSIYKGKGADTDPSNYRPISLLNSIYKLFAAMLQSRLPLSTKPT